MLFVCAVVHLGVRPWRELVLLAIGFIVSYAVGVAVIYALNKAAFDYFGLRVAAWRHPNPGEPLRRQGEHAARPARPVPTLGRRLGRRSRGRRASAVAYFDLRVRPALVRLWFAGAVVIGDHQGTRREFAALVARATQSRPDGARRPVVLYQDPRVRPRARA